MITIAVIDDEQKAIDNLCGMLDGYAREKGVVFSIVSYRSSVNFLENFKSGYDVIFLDIQMPHFDGIETAKRIRACNKGAVLIFVTNMANLAVNGYEVDALDFIVKPLEYFSFCLKMDRVMNRLKYNRGNELLVATEQGVMKLCARDITYIEVLQHTLIYHTEDGAYSGYGSLTRVENELSGYGFARCNSCYLVNLRYVSRIDGFEAYLIGKSGEKLAISHSKKKGFIKALADYVTSG